jgi:phospholipid N-methyltransferase
MNKQYTGWKWREGELNHKQFTNLSSTAKQEYLSVLEQLPLDELSTTDEIILNQYSKQIPVQNKFLEL